MRLLGALARVGPILLLACSTAVIGQETPPEPEPAPPPAQQPEQPPTTPETPPAEPQTPPAPTPPPAGEEKAKGKFVFGLYIEAGSGAVDPDPIDASIETLSTHKSSNQFMLAEEKSARAAVGWKLPNDRGEFRLIFNGYSEDGYRLESQGFQSSVVPLQTVPSEIVISPVLWWTVTAEDGQVRTVRTPPTWDPTLDDANGNGLVDSNEVRYTGSDIDFQTTTFASMQNRAQTYDLVFGNVWGPRRFQGRWWGGFRYFVYKGNIPAGAWLFTQPVGSGYTDGAFVKLINFRQETSGLGPTGLLEARFNFFDQVLQLYLNGQATFIVTNIEVDSGLFSTLVEDTGGQIIPVMARLSDSQTKSTWHTGAEAGLRVRLKNGLSFEASYNIVGLLDAVLLPTRIRIPQNVQEASQATSAIYNTQDYVLEGWHAGVSFQF